MRAYALGTCSTYSSASGQKSLTACPLVHEHQSCHNCPATSLKTDNQYLAVAIRADNFEQALCSRLS